jgi:phosphohistidine phosphatase
MAVHESLQSQIPMNKRLMLVRHGEANSGIYESSDFNRTLSNTGINEAQELAFRLKNKGLIPTLLLSSTAVRAISTAKIFAGIWGKEIDEITKLESIYESSIPSLLQSVNNLNDEIEFAALFGHNPEISAFAEYLTDVGLQTLPTCGVVVIEFAFDNWKMLGRNSGMMSLFDYPGADTAL